MPLNEREQIKRRQRPLEGWERPMTLSEKAMDAAAGKQPRIVIVGAGFGGLSAAKALRRAAAKVTLIDRNNYHLFQPLLYQVAPAALAPSEIAAPLRSILRDQKNAKSQIEKAR